VSQFDAEPSALAQKRFEHGVGVVGGGEELAGLFAFKLDAEFVKNASVLATSKARNTLRMAGRDEPA